MIFKHRQLSNISLFVIDFLNILSVKDTTLRYFVLRHRLFAIENKRIFTNTGPRSDYITYITKKSNLLNYCIILSSPLKPTFYTIIFL